MICFGGDLVFYDERIESVKGKIAKRAILIAFAVTFVLAQIHAMNLLRNAPIRYYWFAFPDAVIYFSLMITLIIGFVRRIAKSGDERTEAEQGVFYSKAASVLIKIALGAFAFDIPIVLYLGKPLTFADDGPSGIIYALLFIVGIYVVYSFRKHDIYFNYSIMENEHYYRSVFRNIGKYGLWVLIFFGISFVPFTGIIAFKTPEAVRVLHIFLEMTVYYLITFVEFSLLYLLWSFLEKSSYRNENSISRSTVISLCLTILLYAVYTAGVISVDALPISQSNALLLVSLMAPMKPYIRFALLIFVTYFGYEYQRSRRNKLISAACATVLLSETLVLFLAQTVDRLLFVFMPELMSQEAYVINHILSTLTSVFDDASCMANAVGFVLMIFALTGDRMISRVHRSAIGGFVILGGVEIFLRTQVDFLSVKIYHFVAEIAVLCYFAVLVACVAVKMKKSVL